MSPEGTLKYEDSSVCLFLRRSFSFAFIVDGGFPRLGHCHKVLCPSTFGETAGGEAPEAILLAFSLESCLFWCLVFTGIGTGMKRRKDVDTKYTNHW